MFYQPFDTKPSDFFQKEHRNNFTYPQHLHICYELIVLLDGKMTVTIDNIPYSLKKNEAVLVFPNQIHSLDSTKSEHILFLFSTRLVQAYFEKNNGLIPTNNKFKIDENIFSFLNSLDENSSKFEKKESYIRYVQTLITQEIISRFMPTNITYYIKYLLL